MRRQDVWMLGLLGALLGALVLPVRDAAAAWEPEGVDLTRPRLLMRPGDLPVVQDRLAREPYQTLLRRIVAQAASAEGWAADDHTIAAEREKSKAAKHQAFLYAVDRTVVADAVVPFAGPADRQAAGDRARDYLLGMYTVSRIADTFDDDINTSEEILSYATAYDTLLGAGYVLSPADDAAIRANLIALSSDLYEDYLGLDPEIGSQTTFLTNNHRTKSGAALAIAAIALAEHTPAPGTDPLGLEEPANWLAYGLAQVDRVLRHAYLTGDGAYSESTHYVRYSGQNHLPLWRAVDRLVGGAPGPVFGLAIPNFWRHPLFARNQRWVVDMTLPNGAMAHIDDGDVGESYYYGMLSSLPGAPLFRWAWENGRRPFESEGSVDLAADQIVAFDDATAAAGPAGSPSAFYVEGGNAIFREDWSADAVVAIALGEHGIASEFARDEQGRGIPVAASHEHADPGSFLLYAFGEQLAIDPGYLEFPERNEIALPRHHNVILVNGKGPVDPFTATIMWRNREAEPPSDGQSTLDGTLDTGFLDAATVHSSYGGSTPNIGVDGIAIPPKVRPSQIRRRFLFPEHGYLVLADDVRGPDERSYRWLLHGNGGGTSGGSYAATPSGAEWQIGAARLTGAFAFDAGPPSFSTTSEVHFLPTDEKRTHTVLRADRSGRRVRSIGLALPSRSADAAPEVADVAVPAGAGLAFRDLAADRVGLAVHRAPGHGELALDTPGFGLRPLASDGSVWSFAAHDDGSLRHAFADDARVLRYDGALLVETVSHGTLGIAPQATRAEGVAQTADPSVRVGGLGFDPLAADGACALAVAGDVATVSLGQSRVFTLRADAGNSAPAADAGPATRTASLESDVVLDGSASCDLDGDPLTPAWELVSAPGGSAWSLTDSDGWSPTLRVDRAGPYRVRLVVTDVHGAASRPLEVTILGGDACANHVDEDRDGLFDALDPQCPAPGEGWGCGLLGIELAPVVAWALARARRRRSGGAA